MEWEEIGQAPKWGENRGKNRGKNRGAERVFDEVAALINVKGVQGVPQTPP